MKILIKESQFSFLIEQEIIHSEGMDLLQGYLLGMLRSAGGLAYSKDLTKYFTPSTVLAASDYIENYVKHCDAEALIGFIEKEGLYKLGYDIFVNRISKYMGFLERIYGEETRNKLIKPSKRLEISKLSINKDGLIEYNDYPQN